MSTLNFTWNVTSYERDQMIIALNFNNPEVISPLIDQDMFVFHILDPQNFFISETLNKNLSSQYHTLRHPVRRQMFVSKEVVTMDKIA